MATETRVWDCPFNHNQALEFDPLLKQLLTEAPIARISMPHGDGHAWLVTRYEDVSTVVTDQRFSRAAGIGRDLPRMTPEPIAQSEAINLMDPPAHTRLRKLVAKGFTPAQVEQMEPKVHAIVDRLLDEMAAQPAPVDFTRHFASRLPITTICEVLAIPEADQPRIRQLAMAMMSTSSGRQATREAKAELRAYFLDLSARRREQPGEDLISALAMARDGDELLDPTELAVMAMVLTVTGHDTSTYQLSNILYTLLTHPEQLALLRSRPELLNQAVEELLRFIPFRHGVGIARVATEDVELGGVTIRAGEVVHVSYLTANHDPEVFERPDELDIERPPAMHMTFGHGTHYCIGANLARAELRIAFASLLQRFPELHLAVPAEQVPWHIGSIWRYPEELPIAW
ncbi:cytochrome P450 [Peterkaempfera bronchialis]|uniref:Cytochrome P450 n=1 Tax=Peterkaempfera bronchialis TaxID=2126346 RepID=A0A345T2R4_9ACTN|nr:cytochrome P450 [Peterkaempfera bronchialis]AXI80269.1 cytochrome P450 [Peterkaempfera bronchialis]